MWRYYYRPQRSWGKVIFSEACVNNSVHGGCAWLARGACMVLFGGGCAWFYLGGACVVLFSGGHAWFYSVGGCAWFYLGGCAWFYSAGGVHGFIQRGHAWFYSAGGACVVLFRGGMRGFFSFSGYNEIRSMSGRYASYWNAFLWYVAISPKMT